MKKVLLSVFALGMLSLASCKKDYTCTCTTTGGAFSGSSSTTFNATKKDAKAACDGLAVSSSVGTTTVTTTCSLD